MLQMIGTECATCDLHMTALWTHECVWWRLFVACGDCKKNPDFLHLKILLFLLLFPQGLLPHQGQSFCQLLFLLFDLLVHSLAFFHKPRQPVWLPEVRMQPPLQWLNSPVHRNFSKPPEFYLGNKEKEKDDDCVGDCSGMEIIRSIFRFPIFEPYQ